MTPPPSSDHRSFPSRCDVVVIGAGIAGSTVAARLADHDLDVVLVERDAYPRDKLCGEFLSSEAEQLLGRLGCLPAVREARPETMFTARLTTPSGYILTADLPGAALGLSRRRLDTILLQHAQHCGARTFNGVEVNAARRRPDGQLELDLHARDGADRLSPLRARYVIAAHGRRSRLDRTLQRPWFEQRSPFVAFKQHHRPLDAPPGRALRRELSGHVELYIIDSGYCGVSFVEDDIVNICTMLHQRHLKTLSAPRWPQIADLLSRANPSLGRRLEALEPLDTPTLAVAQIPFAAKARHQDGLLFVGDAAGMIPPLAGDGQAMALESGLALADLLIDTAPEHLPERWDAWWRDHFARRMTVSNLLQPLMLNETIAEIGIRLVDLLPGLTGALVRATRSTRTR